MNGLIEQVCSPDNLHWAWLKVRRKFNEDDMLCSDLELASFEMNLFDNLRAIGQDLRNGKFEPSRMIPMAHPKSQDEHRKYRIRQAFKIHVRDQVVWCAVVNILGPELECEMPSWSYGNRLFREVFYDILPEKRELRFGHYRHANGHLYRHFRQSWPVFRRAVLFSARAMSGQRIALSDREQESLGIEEKRLLRERLPYIQKTFWQKRIDNIYWGAIDFSKFYPSIRHESVIENVVAYTKWKEDETRELLDQLLAFSVDMTGTSDELLRQTNLDRKETKFTGLPTGLFVSGFLANVAMMQVDKQVSSLIKRRQIAHFRYVDDHTVLAGSFENLLEWLEEYSRIIVEHNLGVVVNPEKTEPRELREFLQQKQTIPAAKVKAEEACKIDYRMPTPLLTKTLAKVSQIAHTRIELQTEEEQEQLLNDVEQLLLTDFPTEELRPDTRMSFAMGQLCRIASKRYLYSEVSMKAIQQKETFLRTSDIHTKNEELIKLQTKSDEIIQKQFKRIFTFIELTLENNPDKLRLWAKAVDFCMHTGYSTGIKILLKSCAQQKKLHPESRTYLEWYVMQRINRDILRAIVSIIDADQGFVRRTAAIRFANSLSGIQVINREDPYGCETANVFREAISCYELLGRLCTDHTSKLYGLEEVRNFVEGHFLSFSETNTKLTNVNYSDVCAWYVDSRITPSWSRRPSYYWEWSIARLSKTFKRFPAFLEKWPQYLSLDIVKHGQSNAMKPFVGMDGWMFEASKSHPRPSQPLPDTYLSLSRWIEACAIFPARDPRRSEWAMLEILSQAIVRRMSFNLNRKKIRLLPYNIFVDVSSIGSTLEGKCPSWEQLRQGFKPGQVELVDGGVNDERYEAFWDFGSNEDPWSQVYSAGLTLLGMLRLDFSFPPAWNPHGQMRLWGGGLSRVLKDTRCSSRTLAILEACILPRNRETQLIKRFGQHKFALDDDTLVDPPDISNLDELLKMCTAAKSTLEQFQFTVQDHEPRQLVPVSMDQIGRILFGSEE